MHTFRVLLTLGPLALSFVRDYRRWLFWGGRVERTPEFHARRAARLLDAVTRLGPTFVKISQIFASRADLIPEPYLGALGQLVDQVPPLPFDEIAAVIREEYGRPVDAVFDEFERTPVAAASLAQVHRARVRGEAVAVKVQRPGAKQRVADDIRAARRILRWLDRWWGHPHIRRELTALAAFETRVREELDFRQEAAYAEAIRANFAGNRHVVIPRIYEEFTRGRVLVLEFMEGTRIDRIDRAHADPAQIVQTLVELYIQMELIDGLFHADPHPGNLLVAPDGRIVLLDFGAVVRVPLAMRRALVNTSIAAIRRDADGVAAGFAALGLLPQQTSPADIRWVAELLITNAYAKTTVRERIDTLLSNRVLATLLNSPITLTEEAVYFARAAALIEGIGTRYDPYFQVVPVASPVVLRMRSRIMRSLGQPVRPSVQEVATIAGYTLGRAAKWLRDRVGGLKRPAASSLVVLAAAAALSACASSRPAPAPAPVRAPAVALQGIDARCDGCGPVALPETVARALDARVAALRAIGGDCAAYGATLEHALATGKIVVRPFMWRVDGALASGTARADNGEMAVALDIDSLNVGARSLDEVVASAEHEAAHLTFGGLPRDPNAEAAVDRRVRSCRQAGLDYSVGAPRRPSPFAWSPTS